MKIPVQSDFYPLAFYGQTSLNEAWRLPAPSHSKEIVPERNVAVRSAKKTKPSRILKTDPAMPAENGRRGRSITLEDADSWIRATQSQTVFPYVPPAIHVSTRAQRPCRLCWQPMMYPKLGLCSNHYKKLRSYFHRTHDAT